MKKGIFISIEGPDGSGKSTQIENIKAYFADRNIPIVFTREPGGTPIGERIRAIILDNNCSEMVDITEAMLYAASRAQHVAQIIRPALERGEIVICDRFVDSSIAYQGYGRDLGEAVWEINKYAVCECMPDVTFLMKVDPVMCRNRIASSEQDRLEHEKDDFHRRVYEGYLEIEKKNPGRIYGIDASKSIEEIQEEIYRKLDEIIK